MVFGLCRKEEGGGGGVVVRQPPSTSTTNLSTTKKPYSTNSRISKTSTTIKDPRVLQLRKSLIMVTTKATTATTPATTTSSTHRSVSFADSIHVRQYERVIGGGGHSDIMASLGIGWRHNGGAQVDDITTDVDVSSSSHLDAEGDEVEAAEEAVEAVEETISSKTKKSTSTTKSSACRDLATAEERVNFLMEYGFSNQEIYKAEKDREDYLVQEQRQALERQQQQQAETNRVHADRRNLRQAWWSLPSAESWRSCCPSINFQRWGRRSRRRRQSSLVHRTVQEEGASISA